MTNSALSLTVDTEWESPMVVCGNPGVGQSTLINSLLSHVVFPSGFLAGISKRFEQQSHYGPFGVRIFDTPGILNGGREANSAAELLAALDIALARPTRLIIVAGVGASLNLVRYEDVEMIKIVMSLVRQRVVDPIEYGLILNQARGKAFAALCDKDQCDTVVKELCNGQLVPNIVLPFLGDVMDEDNALLSHEQIEHVLPFLIMGVRCLNHDTGANVDAPVQEGEVQPLQNS
ncbi:hypothetical protein GGF32_006929 [Allomyces javanicus]|nr:hypothetical protein GGF32_006929 [Allomyces javanicus]